MSGSDCMHRNTKFKIEIPVSVADVSPPNVECPDNFTVLMESDRSYSIVKEFPLPNVSGNLSTIWTRLPIITLCLHHLQIILT